MRKLVLFMNPPGLESQKLIYKLLENIKSQTSFITLKPLSVNQKPFSLQDYFSDLAEFSEKLTHLINDSFNDEIIIVSGFFTTPEEREYIYNAIRRANKKIDERYGVWIEDVGSKLEKNALNKCEVITDLFDYLFSRRVSPTEYEIYKDIYYIANHYGMGTSKKHSLILSIDKLLTILGEDCDNGQSY